MGFLTLPMALLGLAALPVLAGIYLLQTRYRRRIVSSHVIWQQLTAARSGGHRRERFEPPWLLLLLELLILASLVLAAAGPRATVSSVRVPVAVVLDDSFTMQAEDEDGQSVRERAIEAITNRLQPGRHRVRLIAAGAEPRLIGDVIERADQLESALQGWQPSGARADLDAAIARGSEIVGDGGRVLVITHHPPDDDTLDGEGRVLWKALGKPEANAAIINAWRSGGVGRTEAAATFQVANFAETPRDVTVRIKQSDQSLDPLTTTLAPGETRRLTTAIESTAPVRAELANADALAIDNETVLLDPTRAPVRVALAVEHDALREAAREALQATGRVRLLDTADEAELLLTDVDDEAASGNPVNATADRHLVRFFTGRGDSRLLRGPFAVDSAHPLTQGLALTGALWAVGENTQPADANATDEAPSREVSPLEAVGGLGVVMAGNETLVRVAEARSGARTVAIRWRPEGSTLSDSPDWVILFDNLVRWRQSARPGPAETNVPLGNSVTFRMPRAADELLLRAPDDTTRRIAAQGHELALALDKVGLWSYSAGEGDAQVTGHVAVNAARRSASDLRASETGTWGGWEDAATLGRTYRSLAWAVVLLAIGLLLIHAALLRRTGGDV